MAPHASLSRPALVTVAGRQAARAEARVAPASSRPARRALMLTVALPFLSAAAARAEEEKEEKRDLGEVKDVDIRALMLSTMLMGVAGFTAVGAASTPNSAAGHDAHH